MGFIDFVKKKKTSAAPEEPLRNYPQMLTAKLLFANRPGVDKESVISGLRATYSQVYSPDSEESLLYFFPEIEVKLEDGVIAAQCMVLFPNADNEKAEIAPEALQQNWYWEEVATVAATCKYEVLASDFMTRTLDYKSRLTLFMNFLAVLTRTTNPQAVYSVGAQRLIEPNDFVESWTNASQQALNGLVNVRLFNISNGAASEILMDTVGLHLLGLPDFQIRFSNLDESAVGQTLWNYAYYVYEHGDIITDGSTIQGLTPQSKWKCERQLALVAPERVVIHLQPS
ncbi:hypothetical protein GCM10023185_01020 [Hymenobacter saemangeumensis]|uniref:DUF4261 domain-containing protein n=1 Tax=Hymenobacter saemangeumensis TaxID=1084522 RepID=A0ABP8HX41_9BACT